MRRIRLVLWVCALLAPKAWAGDLRNFADAPLHAVQFVDANEGWAVGDEGAVWHTIDGGRTWERQPTGVRASLRSLHFLNPYTGWIAGREELPHGGSAGVLLFTRDGGLKWQRLSSASLPGLNQIRFLDNQTGFVAGDGSDQFPSGVFGTTDTGRTWKPVAGPRVPAWLAADFQDGQTGALVGAWGRLATLRQGALGPADMDDLSGRSVLGVHLAGNLAVAVGQGGLVLRSADSAGARWGYADIKLPVEVRAGWDFHAVHGVGEHFWAAGRPGSVVLHSGDRGQTWQIQRTGQPLPINGLFFLDARHGWAVGELGCILTTADGGQTWSVQRRGGQRAAVLLVHARAAGVPADTVAAVGGEDGYLATVLQVLAPDPNSAAPQRASDGPRLAAAVRQVGGAGAELVWHFPVPQHLTASGRGDLLSFWDRIHGGRGAEQLLRQLVLAMRVWRPNVIITDHPDAQIPGSPAEALVVEAVHEAFQRAADPQAFPEQLGALGLEPWRADKLYTRWEGRTGAHVVLDLTAPCPRLLGTARDLAADVAGLLADAPAAPPAQRFYRLLDSRLGGAAAHRDLMEGIALAAGGTARREMAALAEPDADVLKAIRARRNLEVLAEVPAGGLADPSKVLAQLGPALTTLPDDLAARAAYAVASQFARTGQWPLAQEAFQLMVDRYPTHPLAVAAYRWLLRYGSSSEARRRHELGQFIMARNMEFTAIRTTADAAKAKAAAERGGEQGQPGVSITDPGVAVRQQERVAEIGSAAETRRWYQGSLDVEKRLAAFGTLFAAAPADQFCLQAARRQLGDFETARQWYTRFLVDQRDGPWYEAAAAELWLVHRTGPPPKPVAFCRFTETRPHLDGKLDDPCWQGLKPLVLKNVVGTTGKDYPTEAWLAFDKEFLYLALRCQHPAEAHVAPVKTRSRDADVRPFDHVNVLLDLDRDYATYFHLQIDQRGCVREDCWGDHSWDPRWFVAVHSEPACWQIEAALPLAELTAESVTVGRAWACNVVRVLPGRGVQAWSLPADVEPRPEGMGLLLFMHDPKTPPSQAEEKKDKGKASTPAAN
jgi:photosystem II stability/assembly factor-like uncharacterized protein